MYYVLHEHDQVHERRDQRHHPAYAKAESLATAPNQLWSWDTGALHASACVTKLKGPARWVYSYLYIILPARKCLRIIDTFRSGDRSSGSAWRPLRVVLRLALLRPARQNAQVLVGRLAA
jgi:putative transposase